MRFSFTPEQEEFRSSLRRALEARSPTKEVRRLMATDQGFERDGWQKLNQELGLTAIHIPEAYGGSGFGQGDLAIVLEEMGRGLLCAPFLSTALAANAILNAGTDEQKRALLPAIASGEKTATLAFSEDDGRTDADMDVGLHIAGANPDLYDGYPIEFNLNLEGALANVLRRGLAGYQIPERIREQMQGFGR